MYKTRIDSRCRFRASDGRSACFGRRRPTSRRHPRRRHRRPDSRLHTRPLSGWPLGRQALVGGRPSIYALRISSLLDRPLPSSPSQAAEALGQASLAPSARTSASAAMGSWATSPVPRQGLGLRIGKDKSQLCRAQDTLVTLTQPKAKEAFSICSGVSSNSSCNEPHAT